MNDPQRGAVVLLETLPPASFTGIDLLSFTTNPRFHGIKHVPPGWHFIFTSATNSFSLRHGLWFHVSDPNDTSGTNGDVNSNSPRPELFIFKWNPNTEELVAEDDAKAYLSARANLGATWKESLTPYRQSATSSTSSETVEEKRDWSHLTSCLTPALLTRILGTPQSSHAWSTDSASTAPQDIDHIPGLSAQESRIPYEKPLNFLPIDLKRTWREGATGRERTEGARDRSWALGQLIEGHCSDGNADDLIGEFQMCFIMVLTLNNNSSLEQWRRLLELMLTCREAVWQLPGLFVRFLACLGLQLEHCQDAEGGLFDLSEEGGSLLKVNLRKFSSGLEQLPGDPGARKAKVEVLEELDKLEEYLHTQHGWETQTVPARSGMLELEDGEQIWMDKADRHDYDDEDEETGDYAPVVVDLSPEEAKRLDVDLGEDEMERREMKRRRRKDSSSSSSDDNQGYLSEDGNGDEEMDLRF